MVWTLPVSMLLVLGRAENVHGLVEDQAGPPCTVVQVGPRTQMLCQGGVGGGQNVTKSPGKANGSGLQLFQPNERKH